MTVSDSVKRGGSRPWVRMDPLSVYLNDHLAGATGGLELARRLARTQEGERARELHRLADEIAEDRSNLVEVMRKLHVPTQMYKVAGGWLSEKVARAKLGGRVWARSPLSTVLELETMMLGVEGKAAAWRALRVMAERDNRVDAGQMDYLLSRAERQTAALEKMRAQAADEAFKG